MKHLIEELNYMKDLYFKHGVQIKPFNIFGIRDERYQESDIWNDYIGYFTNNDIRFFKATTDPGHYWTLKPLNRRGTAHLCLGWHKNIWKVDKHRGKYEALCNRWGCGKTQIWRDFDKNTKVSIKKDKLYKGHYGINLHRANALYYVNRIGRYSAGCQVLQKSYDFSILLENALNSGLKKFSYFLFDKSQIEFFNELEDDRTIIHV